MKIFNYLLRTNSCFDLEEYDVFKDKVLFWETNIIIASQVSNKKK